MQSYNLLLNKILIIIVILIGGLFTHIAIADPSHAKANASKSHLARELIGGKLVLQIETVSGTDISDVPNKGVVVQHYIDKNKLTYSGVGDERFLTGAANYSVKDVSHNKVKEVSVDHATGQKSQTTYHFSDPTQGEWKRRFDNSDTIISGHFSFTHKTSLLLEPLVPKVQGGKTLVLTVLHSTSKVLPTGTYPAAGAVILQFYLADGTYTAKGYGPGTVDHFGSYKTTMVAPKVQVEQTLQTIPELNYIAPYTLIYHYETAFSGTWYQSFADGLIVFSGTFSSFDSE
ncbi:hypothetical protein [Paraglaciecola hydrolytica]|uniref:Uncharacterized protein n=1 Tax=Paraglaciecola hydrolytica TaxID=1799789 RepID=A0A136A095_9ALTE|nr:hypothetical protein [Paraglaciecola hydrolytica]KXI28634.1 hypothetical protein AX660_16250 [Paraglaciecola hydrolytica]